jgi:hypothetical protein
MRLLSSIEHLASSSQYPALMKRLILLVFVVAAAAVAGWYAWKLSHQPSSAYVSVLLPRETIFLAHMPDFNGTRDQWFHSDIYALYREPEVQDFLRKPLANLSKRDTASQSVLEIEQLEPKNIFVALTSLDNNNPKIAGGFRFRGSIADAERVIGKWRSQFLERNPGAKREKLHYEHHEIELIAATPFTLATAYDRPWFFATTDLTELKALLDRADGRAKDPNEILDKDESYRAAISHRPSNHALFFYLQPKTFAQRLAALRAAIQSPAASKQRTILEQVRSISGATWLEGGKIYDLLFVGMPRLESRDGGPALTRSSLTLGTKETFFYLSMLLNLGERMETLNQAAGFSAMTQKLAQALSDAGITADDWKAAFGLELGSLADWPSSAHWPTLLLTLPVQDVAKAGKIVEAATGADEGAIWIHTEKDGVRYFSMQSTAALVAITPTIALSDRLLVAGFNPVSVEEAVKRSGSVSSELSDSQIYKSAARLVPAPTNFFSYIDTQLLYSRLDASLRPMLLLAAAFMPAVSSSVDLGKLPSPEVITKHLSPIVSSQRYERDGYVAESVGPITFNQSAIGLAILSGVGAAARQKVNSGLSGGGSLPAGGASPSPSQTPTP